MYTEKTQQLLSAIEEFSGWLLEHSEGHASIEQERATYAQERTLLANTENYSDEHIKLSATLFRNIAFIKACRIQKINESIRDANLRDQATARFTDFDNLIKQYLLDTQASENETDITVRKYINEQLSDEAAKILLNDIKIFTDWLYENSDNIPCVSEARSAFASIKDATNVTDVERLFAYETFITALHNKTSSQLGFSLNTKIQQGCRTLDQKLCQYKPIDPQNRSDLDYAIETWIEKNNDERKKNFYYIIQVVTAFILSSILCTIAAKEWSGNNNSENSEESKTLADAWLLVFFMMTNMGTPLARWHFRAEIKEALDRLVNFINKYGYIWSRTEDFCDGKQISSQPFFETFFYPVQMYASLKYLNIENGNNPLNWLVLTFPFAGLAYGNCIADGFDLIKPLLNMLRKKPTTLNGPTRARNTTGYNQFVDNERDIELAPPLPVAEASSINNDAGNSNSSWLSKICKGWGR